MKYQCGTRDMEVTYVYEADGPFAVEIPSEVMVELESLKARLDEVGEKIYAICNAPRAAEQARREAMTPKQRRAEDYAKAIASFESSLHA